MGPWGHGATERAAPTVLTLVLKITQLVKLLTAAEEVMVNLYFVGFGETKSIVKAYYYHICGFMNQLISHTFPQRRLHDGWHILGRLGL